ncbi:MAG: hypothetical protein A2Y77_04935 [Planctomycetes bacterium RBG_13_62_9]|nr:MAG: hypothetical protein A2Y77_04935 [Planctomycetes bacterium RBG_13_62_9]
MLVSSGAATAQTPDPNLVGWWKLDEMAGAAADSSGHGNTGTVNGAPQWVRGFLDGAFDFNGSTYIDCGSGPSLSPSGSLSVAAWIKMNFANADRKIAGNQDGSHGGYKLGVYSGNGMLEFEIRTATNTAVLTRTSPGGTALQQGTWYHVVGVYSKGQHLRTYVNGKLDRELVTAEAAGISTGTLKIGREPYSGSYFWLGLMDDVRIYNKALTQQEIAQLAFRPKARNPLPADGTVGVTQPLFQWTAGDSAVWHNVYLGTNPELTQADLVAARQVFPMYYHIPGVQPGTQYYWRIDEFEGDGATAYTGDVWTFSTVFATAWAPSPGDQAAYVAPHAVLGWSVGMNAVGHDVYFSADRAAVEAGAPETKKAERQAQTSYPPTGLERGKTYFWRVDEVLVNGGRVTGPVWSFTVRPLVAKTDPSLVGWWKLDDEKAGAAVDYSGYDNDGVLQGGVKFVEGYLGDALQFDGLDDVVDCGSDASLMNVESVSVAAWIRLAVLGGDRKVCSNQNNSTGGYKLGVYSSNNMVEFEIRTSANAATLNRTAPGGTALQQDVWYHVVGVYDKGKSIRTYINGKLDRELVTANVAGISTGPLRLGRESYSGAYWWNGLLDDVRVYNKALTDEAIQKVMQGDSLAAWDPQPAQGANVDIRDVSDLSWSAGDNAATHDVYFGKDKDAVKAADTTSPLYQGRQSGTSFSLAGLVEFGGGSYFWRIDEVEADGTTIRKGGVWGFTVPDYLIVDEFESYTDTEGSRIYEAWIDGWTNGTGSQVGNLQAPFAERTVVHGGKQSMPIDYNNAKAPFYSEAETEFSPLQDWTTDGVTDLGLWFRGQPVAYAEIAPNAFTMSASGADIWGTADQFRFAYKRLSGNGSIVVKVESVANTNVWAKAGVMIRESLEAGSTFAYVVGTPGSGVSFGWRQTTSSTCGSATQAGLVTPQWVKLTRTGNAFTAQYSADGKTWTDIKNADGAATSTTIVMAANVYVGLCVTSHNAAAVTTAQFSGAAITGGVNGQWQTAEIGVDHPGNSPDSLYLAVEDSAGKTTVVTNPDPGAVNVIAWTQWKVPLGSLTGVNLSKVKRMYIGVGDRKNPVAAGSGRIYIDDIWLTKP